MTIRDIQPPERGETTFMIRVLWMHGMSTGNIAIASDRSAGSVRGIVHREFKVARDEMSIEERQSLLLEMKELRCDGGKLPDRYFTALPLALVQKVKREQVRADAPTAVVMPLSYYRLPKPAESEPLPEPDTRSREGRKEIQRRKREELHQQKLEKDRREKREQGGAEKRGVSGSALEYLYQIGWLSDPADRRVDGRTSGLASKDRRKEAGEKMRVYIDGCRIGGLTGIDLGKVGGGSNSRLAISAYRLQAIHALGAIRSMMADRDYQLIESVVDRDEFVWDSVPSSNARSFIYEAIRRALDAVAVFEELMGRQAFKERWGYELPIAKGMDRDEARSMSNRAEEVLRQAR